MFMKNSVLWCVSFALLFLFSCSNAQENSDFQEVETSVLWKIERDDLQYPTYLFGTMHLIEKEYFYFPQSLSDLISQSSNVVMELGGLPDYAATMKLMMLPEGQVMNDFFTEKEMNIIYQYMEDEMNISREAFNSSFVKMKPFVLLQLLTMNQFSSETESYENTITALAKEKQITISGLETAEEQLGFFDQIPLNEFGDMLMEYLKDSETMAEQTREMQRIYRKGDLDSLFQYMTESSPELMTFEDILLTNRNKKWITELKQYIHEKPTFIAVGAGHLAGKSGLVELLRKEGYDVKALSF
jgi:uncharacterized protein